MGDRFLSVDDRSVAGESLPVLRSLVLGPQGSAVKMKFSRQSSHGGAQEFSVSLIRGTSEYFTVKDLLSRPHRLDSVGPSVFPAAPSSCVQINPVPVSSEDVISGQLADLGWAPADIRTTIMLLKPRGAGWGVIGDNVDNQVIGQSLGVPDKFGHAEL